MRLNISNFVDYSDSLKQVYGHNLPSRSFEFPEDGDKRDLIIDLLKFKPLQLMNLILSHVSTKELIKDLYLDCDDPDWRCSDKCRIHSEFKIDEFNTITALDIDEVGVAVTYNEYDDDKTIVNNEAEFKIALNLNTYNRFSGDVELSGQFVGGSSMLLMMDSQDVVAKVFVSGLEKGKSIPSWVEYLIEGCSNIEYGNYKMAIFNLFASLENLINLVHDDIFDFFLEDYGECSNENVKKTIKENIRRFSNKYKGLKNKLNDILKAFNMTKRNGFNELDECCEVWKNEYEDIRNRIAHGGIVDKDYDLGEYAYNVLTLMFSILLKEDLAENQWGSLILFE